MRSSIPEDNEQFFSKFFSGWWRGLIVWGLLIYAGSILLRLYYTPTWFSLLDSLYPIVMVLLWGWNLWWRSRHPLMTISPDMIAWGRRGWGEVGYLDQVALCDVDAMAPSVGASSTPLGLITHSRGTLWISLEALSLEDRQQVREAIGARIYTSKARRDE